VLGAGGYIGRHVVRAIRRDGRRVYGLVRKKPQALELEKNEIIPIIGDITDLKSYSSYIDACSTIIDAAGLFDKKLNTEIRKAVVTSGKRLGLRKRYIYTSGIMTYGDQPGKVVDEYALPDLSNMSGSERKAAMQERGAFEQETIAEEGVDAIVVRPGWVYGNDFGSYLDSWFTKNVKGELELVGNLEKQWGFVHADDLGDAYVRIVNAPKAIVKGEIFDVVDDSRVKYKDLRAAFALASGYKGKLGHREADSNSVPQATSQPAGRKIRDTLGWQPKRPSILDQIDLYAMAFRAHRAKL